MTTYNLDSLAQEVNITLPGLKSYTLVLGAIKPRLKIAAELYVEEVTAAATEGRDIEDDRDVKIVSEVLNEAPDVIRGWLPMQRYMFVRFLATGLRPGQ